MTNAIGVQFKVSCWVYFALMGVFQIQIFILLNDVEKKKSILLNVYISFYYFQYSFTWKLKSILYLPEKIFLSKRKIKWKFELIFLFFTFFFSLIWKTLLFFFVFKYFFHEQKYKNDQIYFDIDYWNSWKLTKVFNPI